MGGKQLQHRDERQSREFAFARWIVNRTGLVFAISLSVPLICTGECGGRVFGLFTFFLVGGWDGVCLGRSV